MKKSPPAPTAAAGHFVNRIAKATLWLTLLLVPLSAAASGGAGVTAPRWGTKSEILKNVHAYDFLPSFSTQGFGVFQNGRYATTGSGAKEFIAPLDLPAGALVDAIAVLACENGTGSVTAFLDRISYGDLATVNVMASIGTLTGQGCQFPGFNPNPAFTIDNHNNLYQLRVVIDGPAGPDLRFYEVLVGYKLQVSPAPASATFADVPTSHPYFRAVEALAASGITAGCGNGNFCPDQAVTRGEMAVFLARALGLHFPF